MAKIMTYKQSCAKMRKLFDAIVEDYFTNTDVVIIGGEDFTVDDMKTFIKMVDNIYKYYEAKTIGSNKYQMRYYGIHKEQKKLSYYRAKKVKTPKDYKKIEQIQRNLDILMKERDKEREELQKNRYYELKEKFENEESV